MTFHGDLDNSSGEYSQGAGIRLNKKTNTSTPSGNPAAPGPVFKSIEATVDIDGRIMLKEPIRLEGKHRAIVTILEEIDTEDADRISEATLLSEQALKVDWDRDEEDAAWSHLQRER